jgi:hypothetical protein
VSYTYERLAEVEIRPAWRAAVEAEVDFVALSVGLRPQVAFWKERTVSIGQSDRTAREVMTHPGSRGGWTDHDGARINIVPGMPGVSVAEIARHELRHACELTLGLQGIEQKSVDHICSDKAVDWQRTRPSPDELLTLAACRFGGGLEVKAGAASQLDLAQRSTWMARAERGEYLAALVDGNESRAVRILCRAAEDLAFEYQRRRGPRFEQKGRNAIGDTFDRAYLRAARGR